LRQKCLKTYATIQNTNDDALDAVKVSSYNLSAAWILYHYHSKTSKQAALNYDQAIATFY